MILNKFLTKIPQLINKIIQQGLLKNEQNIFGVITVSYKQK